MKYIDADKIKAEIERLRHEWPPTFTEGEKQHLHYYFHGLNKVLRFVESMQQEELTPPGIEEESQKKGWLDYGLMMSEIGLHRYNAIHRIKEHKEQFNPQAVPDLYHVAEYYKAVGVELTCCCLQAYGKDFIFTQDEVKEIIEKEGEK
jgi:hypothetical protein